LLFVPLKRFTIRRELVGINVYHFTKLEACPLVVLIHFCVAEFHIANLIEICLLQLEKHFYDPSCGNT